MIEVCKADLWQWRQSKPRIRTAFVALMKRADLSAGVVLDGTTSSLDDAAQEDRHLWRSVGVLAGRRRRGKSPAAHTWCCDIFRQLGELAPSQLRLPMAQAETRYAGGHSAPALPCLFLCELLPIPLLGFLSVLLASSSSLCARVQAGTFVPHPSAEGPSVHCAGASRD